MSLYIIRSILHILRYVCVQKFELFEKNEFCRLIVVMKLSNLNIMY